MRREVNRVVWIAAGIVIVATAIAAGWELSFAHSGPRWKFTLRFAGMMLGSLSLLILVRFILGKALRKALVPQRPFRFKCNACGYSRRGLPRTAPCPECGAAE